MKTINGGPLRVFDDKGAVIDAEKGEEIDEDHMRKQVAGAPLAASCCPPLVACCSMLFHAVSCCFMLFHTVSCCFMLILPAPVASQTVRLTSKPSQKRKESTTSLASYGSFLRLPNWRVPVYTCA